MMHKQPHKDTQNHAGQVINLEQPLCTAIDDYRRTERSMLPSDELRQRFQEWTKQLQEDRSKKL